MPATKRGDRSSLLLWGAGWVKKGGAPICTPSSDDADDAPKLASAARREEGQGTTNALVPK